ncbi:unnamed protein product, partial [Closterium sp. NIES-53]
RMFFENSQKTCLPTPHQLHHRQQQQQQQQREWQHHQNHQHQHQQRHQKQQQQQQHTLTVLTRSASSSGIHRASIMASSAALIACCTNRGMPSRPALAAPLLPSTPA